MSTNYEPTPEQVERMKRELAESRLREFPTSRLYDTVARFILKRQHEREKGLLVFATRVSSDTYGASITLRKAASEVLAAHARLDAPEPTVAECATALRDAWAIARGNRLDGPLTLALERWFAAVEREEARK